MFSVQDMSSVLHGYGPLEHVAVIHMLCLYSLEVRYILRGVGCVYAMSDVSWLDLGSDV